jgi:PKD repeat protein
VKKRLGLIHPVSYFRSMKKSAFALLTSFAIVFSIFLSSPRLLTVDYPLGVPLNIGDGEKEEEENGAAKWKSIRDRFAQEFKQTRDITLNRVPRERLEEGRRYMQEFQRTNKTNAALAGVNWVERGPSNVSGRTRAIMIDPNDASGNSIFSAGVAGGIWKTTNINAATPTWNPVDEFMANMAVTTLAADPSNPLIMYAGTGEGYSNFDAVRGDGIFKSVDGGATWVQLPATTGATFDFIQKIVVNSTGIVLAATGTGGLQRSNNGGTTWTKVLGTGLGITGAASNFCYDVEVAANGDIYSTLNGSLHKSTNAGVTFAAAQTLGVGASRLEIACAPSDANYVYALVEVGNVLSAVLRTTNGGTNWTLRTEPADADPGIPANDFTRDQAWYDLAIAVDPNNRDVLMMGGVDIAKSTDGAASWTQIAHWYGGFGFQYVHADQHLFIYAPGSSSIAYMCNDGGVYRTTDANVAMPTITFKGTNLNVTQFYSCAIHPTAFTNYYLAGAQDNGSQQFSGAGINTTVEVSGGDGGFCHIDQNQPQFQFTQYTNNDYFVSTNSGASWTNVTFTGGQFINPTDYDNVNNRLYASNDPGDYLRWDDPQTGGTNTAVAVAAFAGGSVNAVTVSPNTANRVFFGIDNGRVVRVDNAHAAAAATNISTGLPGGMVSCVEVETGNDAHLLVTYSNYGLVSVWESINSGASWTAVEGNLPDMPIRWALFNPNNSDQVMLATELGVWSTDNLNAGATVWGPTNTGLANIRTDMLQLRQSDDFVILATHGRGLYSTDAFTIPTAAFSATPLLTYTTKTVNFLDESYRATSWAWNFGDGNTSTLQNPTHAYAAAGIYTVTLTINSGASSVTKNAYIQVLPDRGTPYVVASDGSTFEINTGDFGSTSVSGGVNLWERGVPSNALVTVNSPVNVWKTDLDADILQATYTCALQTPSYNLTNAGVYTLRFRKSMETAFSNAPYGVQVHYSTDKGTTWTRLGNCPDALGTNWYNRGPCGTSINASIFADGIGFLQTVNNSLSSYNISFLAGNPNVAFRFLMSVDGGFSAPGYLVDGFMVDDFEILGPANGPSSLPVEGSPLQGIWSGKDATLFWDTYEESNNAGFEIQRSTDGLNFTDLEIVPGHGNSTETHSYTYTDPNPSGERLYYRYRQFDFNGGSTVSNIVELSRQATSSLRFEPHFRIRCWMNSISGLQIFSPRVAKYSFLMQQAVKFSPKPSENPAACCTRCMPPGHKYNLGFTL